MKFTVDPIINDRPQIESFTRPGKSPNSKYVKLVYSRAAWVHLRCRLAEAQNWKCCFCGCVMTEFPGHKHSATMEHVTPRSVSKDDHPDNLVASCHQCNTRRGAKCAYEFTSEILDLAEERSNQAHRRNQKRFAKYAKKLEEYKKNGFPEGRHAKTLDEWFDTLHLMEPYRQQLKDMMR